MITNPAAIQHTINLMGQDVTIQYASNKENVTYDPDTQLPVYSKTTCTVRAFVQSVSYRQIKTSGGLIVPSDRQFIVSPEVDADIGDDIVATVGSGTQLFRVIEVLEPRDKKILIGTRRRE